MNIKHLLHIAVVSLYLVMATFGVVVMHGMSSMMAGDCTMGTLQGIHCSGTSHSKNDGMVNAHLEMSQFFSQAVPSVFSSLFILLPFALLTIIWILGKQHSGFEEFNSLVRQRLKRSQELFLIHFSIFLQWFLLFEKRDPALLS